MVVFCFPRWRPQQSESHKKGLIPIWSQGLKSYAVKMGSPNDKHISPQKEPQFFSRIVSKTFSINHAVSTAYLAKERVMRPTEVIDMFVLSSDLTSQVTVYKGAKLHFRGRRIREAIAKVRFVAVVARGLVLCLASRFLDHVLAPFGSKS